MNDKRKKDELNELTSLTDEQIELIAEKYPILDKSLKKRIVSLCEEKMAMKKDDKYFNSNTENEETEFVENVEIYKKTPWYRNRALTAAASFALVFGAAAGIIAGIKKSDTNDNLSSFSVISNSEKMTESDIPQDLEERSAFLLDSFNCVDKIYGGNIEKDMNSVITIGSAEYAEITDTRFGTKNDLLEFMNNCMTENMIDNRYGNMFDENGGQDAWCAEVDGKLYGKVSARASGFTFVGEPTLSVIYDDTAEMTVNYDNYGQIDKLCFKLRLDGDKWKIDSFETDETAAVSTAPLSNAAKEPVTAAPVEEITDAPVQDVTDAAPAPTSAEIPTNAPQQSSGETEITAAMAHEFINAINIIDQLGGNGADINYDVDDNFDSHDGNRYVRVTEPGFTCVADVRSYMRTYLTDSYISERYSNLIDTDSPMLTDITTSTDSVPRLYSKYSPKGCGFIWTGTEPTIEKQTDDMYTILAEYDNYGAPETMAIILVRDFDGSWKINAVTFGL